MSLRRGERLASGTSLVLPPVRALYTLLFFTLLLLALVLSASTALAAIAHVSWNPNDDPDLSGYRLYWGETSGTYTHNRDAGSQTALDLTGLAEGRTYYFAITAYDLAENESTFSPEIAATVPVSTGGPLIFADSFTDGTRQGDPDWERSAGKWSVTKKKAFVSAAAKKNRALALPVTDFTAGRLETEVKLTLKGPKAPNGSVIFGYQDPAHYRYVTMRKGKVIIGQVGDTPGEAAGKKASGKARIRIGKWQLLTVDVYANGVVNAYVNGDLTPAATWLFADLPPGRVGFRAIKAKTYFDNFAALDESVLP